MKIVQTGIISRSFIWNFGVGKAFDSGLAGTYATPIDLVIGDSFTLVYTGIQSVVSSSNPGTTMTVTDAGGNPLNGGANILGASGGSGYFYVGSTAQNFVVQSGFMQLVIGGGNYLGGKVRFDFSIVRQY